MSEYSLHRVFTRMFSDADTEISPVSHKRRVVNRQFVTDSIRVYIHVGRCRLRVQVDLLEKYTFRIVVVKSGCKNMHLWLNTRHHLQMSQPAHVMAYNCNGHQHQNNRFNIADMSLFEHHKCLILLCSLSDRHVLFL